MEPLAEFFTAIAHDAFGNLYRPCAVDDGVRRGAQFVKMAQVAGAAEGVDGAVGGRNFSVRRHRHVDEDKRQLRVFS